MRALALLCLFLAGCALAPGVSGVRFKPNADGVVVVANVGGGNVQHFLNERARLDRLGAPVELRGFCNSACTVLYSLPTACLARGATLGFHSVAGAASPFYERRIRAHYRAGIAEGYWNEWRKSEALTVLTREQVTRLDPATKICEDY